MNIETRMAAEGYTFKLLMDAIVAASKSKTMKKNEFIAIIVCAMFCMLTMMMLGVTITAAEHGGIVVTFLFAGLTTLCLIAVGLVPTAIHKAGE